MTLRCASLWLRYLVYFLGAENSIVLTENLLAKARQAPLMTLPELPFMASRQQHTVGLRLQKVAEPVIRCSVLLQGVTSLFITCLHTQESIM